MLKCAVAALLLSLGSIVAAANPQPTWFQTVNNEVQQRVTKASFSDGIFSVIGYGNDGTQEFGRANEDTIFEIGSLTKSFTGIIFATLVLEKKLDPEDQVQKYIPELANTFAGKIKLSDLASHKSGLLRVPTNIRNIENPYSEYDWKELLTFLKSAQFDSGSTYSNTGYALLGRVLSIASGNTFDELVELKIAEPLGMTETRSVVPGPKSLRFISGYKTGLSPVPHWDWDVFAPTGSLRSTIKDLQIFAAANLHPEKVSIGPALRLSQQKGWGWDSESLGFPFPYKNGMTGGFASALLILPDLNLAIIGVSNVAVEVDSIINNVLAEILKNPESRKNQ